MEETDRDLYYAAYQSGGLVGEAYADADKDAPVTAEMLKRVKESISRKHGVASPVILSLIKLDGISDSRASRKRGVFVPLKWIVAAFLLLAASSALSIKTAMACLP